MVRVSSAARKSKLLSAALNVAVIDPEVPALFTEVVSADASAALSPPGTVSPPDQVIEARLTLSALSFNSVNVRVAEELSNPVLAVTWGNSVAGCSPASGDSVGGGGLTWSWGTSMTPELL